ncbi:MAG: AAA family ATPase [Acidimicrobiales bacterium]
MLERETVTRAVGEVLHEARFGRGGALFIIGEAGLGKTTVLDYACRTAAPTARVGVARGDVMETALPFGLLAQAVTDLGGADGLDGARRVASPDDARASHFYRTLRWLQALAAEGPVVVGVDDLHWSDGDSMSLLSYLCRRIVSLPVAIVATLRPWPPAAEETCLRLAVAGYARVERLTALTEQAARTLLVDRVGRWVSDDVIDRASASAAGNPLLLEQVALAIERDGPSAQAMDGHQGGAHGLLLPRFGGLPEAGMALARAATVLGSRFRPELATALAHLDEDEATLALDALSRSGLVRYVGAGTAEFTHLLFRQALYNDLPPLVREGLHVQAFRLLLQRGLETEAAEHAVRGNLLGDPEAVDVLVRAGRAALRAGAVTTAVERLEDAVRLASIQAPPELLLLLGEALFAEGRSARAARVYELVLEQSQIPQATRVDTLRMLGRVLVMSGDDTKGTRRFEEAARLAEGEHPLLAVQAMLDLSRAAWLTGGPSAARPAIDRARDMAWTVGPSVRMEVEAAWGFVAFAAGDATGLEAAIAAGQWAEDNDSGVVRDLSWNWGTLRNAGRAAKYAERFVESEAVFSATYAQAERVGSPTAIVSLAAHQADSLSRQGRLDEALAYASRAIALAELAPMAEAFAYVVKALLLLLLDRVDESEDRCRQAEAAATARGQWLPLLRVGHLRALRHYHDGEVDRACALYTRLADRTAELGIGEPCLVPWARHAVVAHLSNGDEEQAARVVAWVEACGARLPCKWPRIAAAAGRARLAEARGDAVRAEEEFRRALALHDEVSLPVEQIETVWQWGSFLRRAGRLIEARDALRDAVALAERTGVPWLAHSVHEELAVAGGRRRRRDGDRHGLTAQEQRVAQLAAGGRSSAEIAGQLSLSVRTIETHLGRIYAKLGIHSQRELMAVRSDAPPT